MLLIEKSDFVRFENVTLFKREKSVPVLE